MTVQEKVKELCKERGIAVYKLEDACGLSRGSVAKWSKHSPHLDSLAKVAAYLEVPLNTLTDYVQTDAQPLPYYLNDETKEIANAVYSSSDLRILFDNSRKMKPEDLKVLIAMQEAILRKEKN